MDSRSYQVSIESRAERELVLTVESCDGVEELLHAIVAAYQARKDAVGFTHILERKS